MLFLLMSQVGQTGRTDNGPIAYGNRVFNFVIFGLRNLSPWSLDRVNGILYCTKARNWLDCMLK